MPSVYLRTQSGVSGAALNIYATGSVGGVAIVTDEITLNDAYGHSSGCYMTHGVVNGDQSTGTPANSYHDFTVTFNHTYTSYPHVVVGFYSTSTAAAFGGLSCAVNSITKTGCKIRVFNNTSTARSPGVEWIAIG